MNKYPPQLRVIVGNWGLKHGPLPKAHFYLDCRALPDAAGQIIPVSGTGPKKLTGDSTDVQDWMLKTASPTLIAAMQLQALYAIEAIPSRRKQMKEEDAWAQPFTILCVCAFGMHRSRAMKHILAAYLRDCGIKVQVLAPNVAPPQGTKGSLKQEL